LDLPLSIALEHDIIHVLAAVKASPRFGRSAACGVDS